MKRMLVLAMLIVGAAGCNVSTPTSIYVGHVSDKTRLDKAGDQAELGIRLALAELSKDGALAGSLGERSIQVRHTDTRGELDAFESEGVRLVQINKCISLFGGLSAREVEKLDRAQVPLLTFDGHPVVGVSNLVFYLGMMPTQQGEALANVIAEEAATTRIVILLDERRADSAAVATAFQKAWPAARKPAEPKGETVVLRFGKDAKWAELIEQIHAPHAIVFAGGVQDFNAWHKVFRKELFSEHPQLIYAGDDGEQGAFDLGDDPKTNVLLATAFPADPANQKVAAFAKAYHEAFQTEADVHAALAYDGFRLLAEALKRTYPLITTERLRDELQKTKDFEGVTGPLTIMADRQVQRPLNVVRWQNGKLAAVKAFALNAEKKEP
jgi:branched-chain amino acid transport system substrate-binding protein